MQSGASIPYISPRTELPAWQVAEWSAHIKKCLRDHGPTHHPVSVSVTIGRDGMIEGDPEIISPIDTDAFKDDVKTIVRMLHRCEPLVVDPFGIAKGPFRQRFNFPVNQ